MSRGIPRETAMRIIVQGFFDPVMQRIPFEGVRERIAEQILEKVGTLAE
jgi:Fe-S cluster assembly protein SufD